MENKQKNQQDQSKNSKRGSKGTSSSNNSKAANQAPKGKEHSDTEHPHEEEMPVAKQGANK